MFQKQILALAVFAFFGLISSQEINPKLFLADYGCDRGDSCTFLNSHCNPLKRCQCNFGYLPAGGKEYKECNQITCYIDDDCEYFYGPNTQCVEESDSYLHCRCKQGWSVDKKTQECIVQA